MWQIVLTCTKLYTYLTRFTLLVLSLLTMLFPLEMCYTYWKSHLDLFRCRLLFYFFLFIHKKIMCQQNKSVKVFQTTLHSEAALLNHILTEPHWYLLLSIQDSFVTSKVISCTFLKNFLPWHWPSYCKSLCWLFGFIIKFQKGVSDKISGR